MTMQFDVKAAHLNQSGIATIGRVRLKQFTFAGNAGQSGKLALFDCVTAPVTTGTYARSGTTVTVTQTAHGLVTGDVVGISFNSASNVSATDGNYPITKLTADTFTITDINSGTVAGGTACQYSSGVNRWISTYETLTGATATTNITVPGEGLLCNNGVYTYLANMGFVTVHYG
jgi:hypothetical protein